MTSATPIRLNQWRVSTNQAGLLLGSFMRRDYTRHMRTSWIIEVGERHVSIALKEPLSLPAPPLIQNSERWLLGRIDRIPVDSNTKKSFQRRQASSLIEKPWSTSECTGELQAVAGGLILARIQPTSATRLTSTVTAPAARGDLLIHRIRHACPQPRRCRVRQCIHEASKPD